MIKVLNRFLAIREDVCIFLIKEKDDRAVQLLDNYWIVRLLYMVSIFEKLNQLNLSLQGFGGDIFFMSQPIKNIYSSILLNKTSLCGNLWKFEGSAIFNTQGSTLVWFEVR